MVKKNDHKSDVKNPFNSSQEAWDKSVKDISFQPQNFSEWLTVSHNRLLCLSAFFILIYTVVAIKALFATILMPMDPNPHQIKHSDQIPHPDPRALMSSNFTLPNVHRATITDRNGQTLAISLPIAQIYANPQEIINPLDVAKKIHRIVPTTSQEKILEHLKQKKQFVYLVRNITPAQEITINNLGIPGIYFEQSERRHYPLGHMASQILGSVDIDDHGVAGIEKYMEKRLSSNLMPLRLSLDARIQTTIRDELYDGMQKFDALGAAAILMDIHTGEIISMVSLPDFDSNNFNHANENSRFNRAVTGLYEPGSTFKIQTIAMALQYGTAHIWDKYSTVPIHIGKYTISDLKTDHFPEWLPLPEVLAFSSNPAAAHIALDVGSKKQEEWLRNLGFLNRVPIELPETSNPLAPSRQNWGQTTVMTISFGHGIAESPLSIARGTAIIGNGGFMITPTLIAKTDDNLDIFPQTSTIKVLSDKNALMMQKLLRLVVTHGIGRHAESPGYFIGGKTGTAEKIGTDGHYLKHVNITAFTGIFPMYKPKYALYVMVDSPHGTKETHGQTTAGWIAAPIFSKIVAHTAPMLGIFPVSANEAIQYDKKLSMPSAPTPPHNTHAINEQ